MSMKFANRDFEKNPLTRSDTQIQFDPELDKSMTQQHHNIGDKLSTQKIVASAFAGQIITHTRDQTARFIDASAVQDFQQLMQTKFNADQAFAAIPDEIRLDLFNNNPADFVDFCLDPKNIDKLRELGLSPALKTTETLKPLEVVVVSAPPPRTT
nr:MAG TPA: Scaffold protein [Microviridae sp.]